MNSVQNRTSQLLGGAAFALLWGISLYGVVEIDLWAIKLVIITGIAVVSFGLEEMLYGKHQLQPHAVFSRVRK